MSITFAPTSLDFGNVAVDAKGSQGVTVTNTDPANPVTLAIDVAAFSIPATTIPPGGSVLVPVVFSPKAPGFASTSIVGSGAQGSCTLTGTGVAPATLDPQGFESEENASAGVGATHKYYQIAVPNFALNEAPAQSGNSFVRLGSFPDLGKSAAFPDGFQKSLDLAKLVGDAAAIVAAETGIDTVPGGFSDGSGLPGPYDGKSDPNYLLGFADDTRLRAGETTGDTLSNANTIAAGQTVSNTAANRQKETKTLLTKGGWWDHSDGNRVTTTVGDKVEVVQGNYKLVVLGRQPLDTSMSTLVGNAFITDVSGGHFQEQYPSPTPCIKTIEYSLDDKTGEWTLYQDNGIGNLITKLRGRTVDMFQGTKREAYVGSSGAATDGQGALDPVLISKTWATSVLSQTGSEDKPVGGSLDSWIGTGSDNPVGPATSASASTGDVLSLTWAQRVRSYLGSPAAHVKQVYSETHADSIQTYTFAESSVAINGVLNTFELTLGVKESVQVGAQLSLFLGATASLYLGGKLDLAFPQRLQIDTAKFEAWVDKVATGAAMSSLMGAVSHLNGAKTSVNGDKTDVNGVDSNIAAEKTILAPEVIIS